MSDLSEEGALPGYYFLQQLKLLFIAEVRQSNRHAQGCRGPSINYLVLLWQAKIVTKKKLIWMKRSHTLWRLSFLTEEPSFEARIIFSAKPAKEVPSQKVSIKIHGYDMGTVKFSFEPKMEEYVVSSKVLQDLITVLSTDVTEALTRLPDMFGPVEIEWLKGGKKQT